MAGERKQDHKGSLRFLRPRILSGPVNSLALSTFLLMQVTRAIREYGSLKAAGIVLKVIKSRRDDYIGKERVTRSVFTGRKFHWTLHEPGFPSSVLTRNFLGEMQRVRPISSPWNRLRILFIGITNQCPLRCRHCYEVENLGKPDTLGVEDYKAIIGRFLEKGVGQVHFGGGEPLARFDVLVELVGCFHKRAEMWLATSGYGLGREKALALQKAGLTGAAISVDHFDPDLHNEFRGSHKSFEWALQATANCREAGMIVCWSICVTPTFLSSENLYRYATLAGEHGVHFIQLFEPVPVGGFLGQSQLVLSESQLELLDDFYVSYNRGRQYRKMPLVTWAGYHQRRLGCMGAGNRYVYADAAGNIHSCPFCRNHRQLDIREMPPEEIFSSLAKEECQFRTMRHFMDGVRLRRVPCQVRF